MVLVDIFNDVEEEEDEEDEEDEEEEDEEDEEEEDEEELCLLPLPFTSEYFSQLCKWTVDLNQISSCSYDFALHVGHTYCDVIGRISPTPASSSAPSAPSASSAAPAPSELLGTPLLPPFEPPLAVLFYFFVFAQRCQLYRY